MIKRTDDPEIGRLIELSLASLNCSFIVANFDLIISLELDGSLSSQNRSNDLLKFLK